MKKELKKKLVKITKELQKNIGIKEKLESLQGKESQKMDLKINKAKEQLKIANELRQKA